MTYLSNVYNLTTIDILSGPSTWSALNVILAISLALATSAVVILLISFIKAKKPELEYVKQEGKIENGTVKLFVISAIISLIIWCAGTFM